MLFPLWEANKAAIPTILRKANAESGGQGRVSPQLSPDFFLHTFMALSRPRSLYSQGSTLASSQPWQEWQMSFLLMHKEQRGKVSGASKASSLWNASYKPFCRDCSLKSHLLALKELYSNHALTIAHKQEKQK